MNISKPISTASRLRATFTSSAAPERAGKPIHATLSLDPGLHRRLKLAAATRRYFAPMAMTAASRE